MNKKTFKLRKKRQQDTLQNYKKSLQYLIQDQVVLSYIFSKFTLIHDHTYVMQSKLDFTIKNQIKQKLNCAIKWLSFFRSFEQRRRHSINGKFFLSHLN